MNSAPIHKSKNQHPQAKPSINVSSNSNTHLSISNHNSKQQLKLPTESSQVKYVDQPTRPTAQVIQSTRSTHTREKREER